MSSALRPVTLSTLFWLVLPVLAAAGCRSQPVAQLTPLTKAGLVDTPDTVTIEVKNYCPAAGRTYKDLLATNLAVTVAQGDNRLDTDLDGVPDFIEETRGDDLNISPAAADSNGDGYGDLLMYLAGIERPQQGRLRCLDQGNTDGSGIVYADPGLGIQQFLGLRNCEKEQLVHTEPALFDGDGDGLPDYLELRCGLNPRDPQDALLDTDGDGLNNYLECKRHTPTGEVNQPQGIRKLEYAYTQTTRIVDGRRCNDFLISNISILNRGDRNLIALYLIETDGLQKTHLYTSFELLAAGASGKTFVLEFGPAPGGRFTAR